MKTVKQPGLSMSTGMNCLGYHPNVKPGDFDRHINYMTCVTDHKP